MQSDFSLVERTLVVGRVSGLVARRETRTQFLQRLPCQGMIVQ